MHRPINRMLGGGIVLAATGFIGGKFNQYMAARAVERSFACEQRVADRELSLADLSFTTTDALQQTFNLGQDGDGQEIDRSIARYNSLRKEYENRNKELLRFKSKMRSERDRSLNESVLYLAASDEGYELSSLGLYAVMLGGLIQFSRRD